MGKKKPRGSRPRNDIAARTTEAGAFQVRATQFAGPIPPPTILRQYDELLPGAADRLLQMAESNARHRQGLEAQVVTANCRAQDRGQVFGFIITLTVIVLGASLIYAGHEAKGFAMIVGAATTLLGTFMWGRTRQERERREKAGAFPSPPELSS